MTSETKKSMLAAIKALKTASRKAKITAELEDSLEQLGSIGKFLKIPKLLPNSFHSLASLLRQPLLPLYRTFPILGIRYSVAVLITIHEEKIVPSLKSDDRTAKDSWEIALSSLLSGILDFLEENPSNENRAVVATAFYPTLRTVFFPRTSPFRLYFGADLAHTLYQLLSETVTLQPVNQDKLRDQEFLGGPQIGTILSHSKDFLAIEALLELFAKLLPPKQKKTGLQERAKFVKEVFNQEIFTCSSDIVALFRSATTTDWEVIFLQIVDILANANITFPQPFQINSFRIQGTDSYAIDRLYVDNQGLMANLDEDGQLETFHIAYPSIRDIKIGPSLKQKTSIMILLSSPPSIGSTVFTRASNSEIVISFEFRNQDVSRFLESLKNRGLQNITIHPGRKISKAEASLELDFSSKDKKSPVPTQDKVRDLARLWDSQSRSGEALPTSPLISCRSISIQPLNETGASRIVPVVEDKSGSDTQPQEQSSAQYDSIFGPTDEGLTDSSNIDDPQHPRRRSSVKYSKADIVIDSDDQADVPIPYLRRRINQKIVISDDEVEDFSLPLAKVVQPPKSSLQTSTPLGKKSKLKAPSLQQNDVHLDKSGPHENLVPEAEVFAYYSPGKPPDLSNETQRLQKENVSTFSLAPMNVLNGLNKTNKIKDPDISPAGLEKRSLVKVAGKKRKTRTNPGDSDLGTDQPPTKRPRMRTIKANTPSCAEPEPVPRGPPAQKRYGKRGHTSPPVAIDVHRVDFDKLPAPSPKVNKPEDKQKGRVSAMKGKGGNKAAKIKPVPRRPRVKESDNTDAVSVDEGRGTNRACTRTMAKLADMTTTMEDLTESITRNTQRYTKAKLKRRSVRAANISANSDTYIEKPIQPENSQQTVIKPSVPQPRADSTDKGIAVLTKPQLPLQKVTTMSFDGNIDTTNVPSEVIVESSAIVGKRVDLPLESLVSDEIMEEEDIIDDDDIPIGRNENEIIMIDLTRDSPKPRVAGRPPLRAISPTMNSPVCLQALTKQPPLNCTPPENKHPRVSFAPSATYQPHLSFNQNADIEPSPIKGKNNSISPIGTKSHYKHYFENELEDYSGWSFRQPRKDPMPEIIEVIEKITQIIISNRSQRFDTVRKELQVGHMTMLRDATYDLRNMVSESIDHFHNLVSLETEYAAYLRKILDGLEDVCKINQELSLSLARTIQEHNCNSLSRKLPNTFFRTSLPAVILNPKLNL